MYDPYIEKIRPTLFHPCQENRAHFDKVVYLSVPFFQPKEVASIVFYQLVYT